jgi:hypothetical protein
MYAYESNPPLYIQTDVPTLISKSEISFPPTPHSPHARKPKAGTQIARSPYISRHLQGQKQLKYLPIPKIAGNNSAHLHHASSLALSPVILETLHMLSGAARVLLPLHLCLPRLLFLRD